MPKQTLIGAHVSAAGGVDKAAARAREQGCEVMQIFVQNPQQYQVPQTTAEEVKKFQESLRKSYIAEVYVHTPYLINLGSVNNRIRYGSVTLVRKNLERASALGCKYIMTHLGSYGEQTEDEGQKSVIKALGEVLDGYTGETQLLLELAAGSGRIIGSRFEEIHQILTGLKAHKIGVCLDTMHIFASGYDLRGKPAIDATLNQFDQKIGLKYLKLMHINDSAVECGSHKDRHADIGDGLVGLENFEILINHPKLRGRNWVLETPGDVKRRKKDITKLKKFQIRNFK